MFSGWTIPQPNWSPRSHHMNQITQVLCLNYLVLFQCSYNEISSSFSCPTIPYVFRPSCLPSLYLPEATLPVDHCCCSHTALRSLLPEHHHVCPSCSLSLISSTRRLLHSYLLVIHVSTQISPPAGALLKHTSLPSLTSHYVAQCQFYFLPKP